MFTATRILRHQMLMDQPQSAAYRRFETVVKRLLKLKVLLMWITC